MSSDQHLQSKVRKVKALSSKVNYQNLDSRVANEDEDTVADNFIDQVLNHQSIYL